MPNGFQGSRDAWERIAAPLRDVDDLLVDFAEREGLKLGKDERAWPNRSLTQSGEVTRKLEIFLADKHELTYGFCAYAWTDREQRRYLKRELLCEQSPWAELKDDVPGLLDEGLAIVRSWAPEDVPFAVDMPEL